MLYPLATPLRSLALAFSLALVVSSPLHAAITLGPDGEELLNDTESKNAKLLGPEYKDEAAGFKLNTPANARIVQLAGLELVSFFLDNKQWGGSVQLIPLTKDMAVEAYLKSSAEELTKTFKAVQILESRELVVAGKPAGKLVASMEAVSGNDKTALLKQQLAVQIATNEYLLLMLYSPLSSKDEAVKTFDAMTATFDVLDRKQIEAKRRAAIDAGKKFLTERSAEELTPRLLEKPQLFRIKIENRDVGYVRFDEREDAYLGYKGIRVNVNSRTFPPDGSIVMGQNTAFWAYKKQDAKTSNTIFSSWQNNVKSVIFNNAGQQAFWTSELGTLQFGPPPQATTKNAPPQYILSVTRGGDRQMLNDTGIKSALEWGIEDDKPRPLPKVLEYLWPRIIDLSQPSQIAFSVFNSAKSHMALRTLTVSSPETITLDGREYKATRLTDELDPGSTTLWVDSTGKTLMMRTSDQSLLIPTTEEKMAQMWGAKLAKLSPANK